MRVRWAAAVVLCLVPACGPDVPPAGPPATASPAPAPPDDDGPKAGDVVRLVRSGGAADVKDGETWFVRAVPPEAWKDYKRFAAAGDADGLRLLSARRDAYLIDSPTRAKVIGVDSAGYDVRVQDGRFAGREFWVLRQSVDAPAQP